MYLLRSIVCVATLSLLTSQLRADDSAKAVDAPSVWVTSVAKIGNTDQFVAATANGLLLRESTVTTFDVSDPATLTTIYTHPAAAWCVDTSSDGKTIASVDYRGNLVVYDVAAKKPTTHEKAFERWCQAMLITPDDKHIVAGNEAGKLMQWDIQAGKVTKSVELDAHAITGLAIAPDGSHLAASDGAGHVHLLKWPSLEEAGKIEVSQETVWCVAFTQDNQHLICGSSDRNLYRCEAKPDAKAESIAKGKDWITRIAISDSGNVAASEVSGRLHFPSVGGTDSMEAKSGVWALCWNGDSQLIAGTRKNGLVTAGQSWKWTEAPKPKEPAAKEPAEKEESKQEAAKEEKPEVKSEAEKKPEADKEATKEAPKQTDKKEAESPQPKDKKDAPSE
ncbi:MAG: hypothetical protein WBD20_00110 [Pirellulaceae bacterium]